jgi:sugar phosphate isomerase/epimerase
MSIPFNVGTTSFIKWDTWQENVKYLHNKVDYIQLLLLEDIPQDRLPTQDDIKELNNLKQQFDSSYSVHLPHSIQLAIDDKRLRELSVDRVKKVIDLVQPLDPVYFILHGYVYDHIDNDTLQRSVNNLYNSLNEILEYYPYSRKIGLETLHFEFDHLEDLVNDLDTSVIVDVGQNIRYKKDYLSYIRKYFHRVVDIHLHGFDGKKDHCSLNKLPHSKLKEILKLLLEQRYNKNILLEVFSEKDFNESYKLLYKVIKEIS